MKWVLFFVSLFLLFIAFNIQSGWLFVLDFLLLAFMVSAWLLPFVWTAGEIRAERFAARVFEGEDAEVLLRLSNLSRFEKRFLIIEDSFPARNEHGPVFLFLPFLAKNETAELRYAVKAEQRGVYSFNPLWLRSLGPAGFFERRRKLECNGSLVVYPVARPFPLVLEDGIAAPLPGEKGMAFGKGDGEEFYGIREYEPGDSLRAIHWASSAKMGKIMIRDMMRTHPSFFTLYLDCDARLRGTAFETCVKLATYAAGEILRQGHRLSFFQEGAMEPMEWWGSMEFLANIQPEEGRSLDKQMEAHLPILTSQRELFIFTAPPPAFSEASWRFVAALRESGVEVAFVFVGERKPDLEQWLGRQGASVVFVGEDSPHA